MNKVKKSFIAGLVGLFVLAVGTLFYYLTNQMIH